MPTIPYRESAEFPSLPTQTPVLTVIKEAEFTSQDNPFFGKRDASGKVDERRVRDVVKVVFEAVDDEYWTARAWRTFGASIHEKAGLRALIQATEPTDLTTELLKSYNTDSLVGKYVSIVGDYSEGDTEHKYLRPKTFLRADKKAVAAAKEAAKSRPATTTRSEGTVREVVAAAAGSEIEF